MRKNILILLISVLFFGCGSQQGSIEIIVTTDVHGNLFFYPPEKGVESGGSLSKVAYLVDSLRNNSPHVLVFDNGDLIQGTPDIYFFNYIDTAGQHPIVDVMQCIGYDAASVGNHDIECGPLVYNRLKKELKHSWLAANIVSKETGETLFEPYAIVKLMGLKIAVLGLITPGVPNWLPEPLWDGMEFEDMILSSRKWMSVIMEKEKPDFVIGLFHSGWDATYGGGDSLATHNENASLLVARQVPGFNLIFLGHDHQQRVFYVDRENKEPVIAVDCGSHARSVGRVTLSVCKNEVVIDKAWVEDIVRMPSSERFNNQFLAAKQRAIRWKNSPVCETDLPIYTIDALFGPSIYMNLIHNIQLLATGADISLAAPLSIYNFTSADTLRQHDMFALYPFENLLYSMRLKGDEIIKILEYSTGLWFNQAFPVGSLLQYQPGKEFKALANPFFSFVSAGGVDYVVDFSPDAKGRVHSLKLHNGKDFDENSFYFVAINSYQASGGGGHLFQGAGLSKEDVKERTLKISDKEIRAIMADYLEKQGNFFPDTTKNWSVKPHDVWMNKAKLESARLFK